MAAVRTCRALIRAMRKAGWGRVILPSSEDAIQPYPEEMPYCACKAGVLNLAKNLSKAYAKDGVLVNTVSPCLRCYSNDGHHDRKAITADRCEFR